MSQAIVGKSALQEANALVARFITGKGYQAIFNTIRVSIRDGKVILSGMDASVQVERVVDPFSTKIKSIDEHTDILVEPDKFKGIITTESSDSITLTILNNELTIKGKGTFKLKGNIDIEDYPNLEDVEYSIDIPWESLRRGLERSSHFTSSNLGGFQIQGSRILILDGKMRIMATDGSALLEAATECSPGTNLDVIVPDSGIEALTTISQDISLTLAGNRLGYRTGLARGAITVLSGDYPNVDPILDSIDPLATAFVKVQDLLDVTKRVKLVGVPDAPIRFTCGDQELTVSSENAVNGSASVSIPCNTEGKFTLVARPSHVVDFLRHVLDSRNKEVEFSISRALSNGTMPLTMHVEKDVMDFRYLAQTIEGSCH